MRRQVRDEAPLLSTLKKVSPDASSRTSTLLKVRSWQWIVMFAGSLRVYPGTRVKGFGEGVEDSMLIKRSYQEGLDEIQWMRGREVQVVIHVKETKRITLGGCCWMSHTAKALSTHIISSVYQVRRSINP